MPVISMPQYILIYVLLMYTGQVLLGFAVYHDAKSRDIDLACLWGVIAGVIGFIPAIVYLAMRSGNKNTIKCPGVPLNFILRCLHVPSASWRSVQFPRLILL